MAYVLALYVLGMVICRHCGQTQIATLMSGLVGCQMGTMKQRLREFTYAGNHKRGANRCTVEVKLCFAPLLGWVLSKFAGDQRQVVLALDASYLKDRFVILAVSVVVAGTAIPVAWHIQSGDQKGEWNPIWLALLAPLRGAVPAGWQVFVLADSGLYSKKLYRKLAKTFKWHVLMRISGSQGLFKARGARCWQLLRDLVKRGMDPLVLPGQCFKGQPVACTLVAQWDAEYDQPCLIVTNLHPQALQPNIYGIRYWIECGFKDIKRGLLHWEQTKMICPQRAARLWLVISIALLWLTALGDAATNWSQCASLGHARPQARSLSAPMLGWIEFILTLLKGASLNYGYFNPYPWLPLPEP
jgi:hypothetical protein